MSQKPKLVVLYRVDDGFVTAVFPTIPGTNEPFTATCYARVGQHSSCSKDWYTLKTKIAREPQYESLHKELKKIYHDFDLVVGKRWTQAHDTIRRAELERMTDGPRRKLG